MRFFRPARGAKLSSAGYLQHLAHYSSISCTKSRDNDAGTGIFSAYTDRLGSDNKHSRNQSPPSGGPGVLRQLSSDGLRVDRGDGRDAIIDEDAKRKINPTLLPLVPWGSHQ